VVCSEDRRQHGRHRQADPESAEALLEVHLRRGLPLGAAPGLPPQQRGGSEMPLRGAAHGGVLGVRSAAPPGHLPHPHGVVPPDGDPGLGQNFTLLSQRDQYDVRRRIGHRHSGRVLQSAHKGGPLCHTDGKSRTQDHHTYLSTIVIYGFS
jgi:hypothetical protein